MKNHLLFANPVVLLLIFFNSTDLMLNNHENSKQKSSQETPLIEKYKDHLVDQNEITTRRSTHAQHFSINDTLSVALIHTRPLFYFNHDGSLTKIDNQIIPVKANGGSQWAYRNMSNDIIFYFSSQGDECLIMQAEGPELMWITLKPSLTAGQLSVYKNELDITAADHSFQTRWIVNSRNLTLEYQLNTPPYNPENLVMYDISGSNKSKFIKAFSDTRLDESGCAQVTDKITINMTRFNRKNGTGARLDENNRSWTYGTYFNIRSAGDSSLAASGKVYSDGTNVTKYDGELRIQNTSPAGCLQGYRSWVKFDISTIPDESIITDVEQYIYCTQLKEDFWDYLNYNIYRVDNDPVPAEPLQLWHDIYDGSRYELREWVSNPPAWEWCDLDPPGDADCQSALVDDWFGLGYMVVCDEDDDDFFATFNGVGDPNAPYLAIEYKPSAIEHITPEAPVGYRLEQNYPNPFNATTLIEFTLPRPQYVELRIFDVLGKEVELLITKDMPAGSHRYLYNAGGLASGVYYYQIIAGPFRNARKMILVR